MQQKNTKNLLLTVKIKQHNNNIFCNNYYPVASYYLQNLIFIRFELREKKCKKIVVKERERREIAI